MTIDKYQKELYEIIHGDRMYDYEEVNMTFLAAKLVQLSSKWERKLTLILRSDLINEWTYWFIRYYRGKNIEPCGILSTALNKERYVKVSGIPVITINELNVENTTNSILIVINRESDVGFFTQPDYRESEYGFYFRARAELGFCRDRGVENLYYIMQHEEEYYKILAELRDEESKKTYIEIIRSLIENDIYRYKEYESKNKYFDDKIYRPLENEVWINCGSCTGDSILHYLALERQFKKIYAVEIEDDKIQHLERLFELFPKAVKEKIKMCTKAFEGGDSEYSIDNILRKEKVTLINMDIEGAEMTVLEGAIEKLRKDRPVLAVAAYHKAEDLIAIPNFILENSENYLIYLRKCRGYRPDVMNEYIYYAVPVERAY
jgi:hypothetical protein